MSLPISARVLGAVCLLLIVFTLNLSPSTFYSATFIEETYFEPELMPNILDGCHHVYLDMGTNTGVQVMLNIDIVARFCIPLNRSENYTSRTCFLKLKFSQCLTNSLDPHLKGSLETFTFYFLEFS